VSDSLLVAVGGVAAGLVAAATLARLMASMLFETAPADPRTLAGTVALLLAASFGASFVPARRAARIDPAVTLRAE
jgi:putative ABC transport system permease protein